MPRAPRGAQFLDARRREGRDTHARYYAVADYPNRGEFGAPEYVDATGRQYRVAFLSRLGPNAWPPRAPIRARARAEHPIAAAGGTRVKLWVKLPPRGADTAWFRTLPATVALEPVAPGRGPLVVRVHAAFRARPTHSTGYVMASGVDENS